MRAIVTGGAGFIGSHLADRLLREGWDVLVVDNLSSGYLDNVPAHAEFLWMDLTDEDAVNILPKGTFDAVFHLASHVGQELSFQRPVYDLKANAVATLQLLQWCVKHGVQRFIFASSVNVYGNATEMPIRESAPVVPPSPYAVGKLASEHLCKIYQGFGINTSVLRLFNVYGPRQDMRNMLQGMASIYMSYVARKEPILVRGSQDRFRDFSYVDDVTDAFYRCLDERAVGKIYNVASGRKTYVRDIIEIIIKAFGADPASYPIISGEPTTNDQFGFYGDSTKIRDELGWRPRVGLEEGIAKMAQWVISEGFFTS